MDSHKGLVMSPNPVIQILQKFAMLINVLSCSFYAFWKAKYDVIPVDVPDLPWLVKPLGSVWGIAAWLLIKTLNIAGMLPKFGAFSQLAAL